MKEFLIHFQIKLCCMEGRGVFFVLLKFDILSNSSFVFSPSTILFHSMWNTVKCAFMLSYWIKAKSISSSSAKLFPQHNRCEFPYATCSSVYWMPEQIQNHFTNMDCCCLFYLFVAFVSFCICSWINSLHSAISRFFTFSSVIVLMHWAVFQFLLRKS